MPELWTYRHVMVYMISFLGFVCGRCQLQSRDTDVDNSDRAQ